MAAQFPTALDSFPTNRADATAAATTHAADHNDGNDAINKIEREIGLIPGWGPTMRSQPASRGLMMTGAKLENLPRWGVQFAAQTMLASGTVRVFPLGVLRLGESISSLSVFVAAAASGAPTNSWAGIARLSDRVVLARSNTVTTNPTANTLQTFTFSASYTPTADEVVVGFVMYQVTTPPTLLGVNVAQAGMVSAPVICGTSNTGATTPVAVSAVLTAFTADTEVPYAQLR
jgi:hypothetical protein